MLVQAESGNLRYIIDCEAPACGIAFSHAQRSLCAVATHEGVQVHDQNSGALAHRFEDAKANALCFSPSGYAIAYGTAIPGKAQFVVNSLRIDACEKVIGRLPVAQAPSNPCTEPQLPFWPELPKKPRNHRNNGIAVPIERSDHFPIGAHFFAPVAPQPYTDMDCCLARLALGTSHCGSLIWPYAMQKRRKASETDDARNEASENNDLPNSTEFRGTFKCASVAVFGEKLVVAAVTEDGRLVLTPRNAGDTSDAAEGDEMISLLASDTYAARTCLALHFDVLNNKMFLAYEQVVNEHAGTTKSKLVVLDVTDITDPKTFDPNNLKPFDTKKAISDESRFSRVAFSERCNILCCYTNAGHLAACVISNRHDHGHQLTLLFSPISAMIAEGQGR